MRKDDLEKTFGSKCTSIIRAIVKDKTQKLKKPYLPKLLHYILF